MNCSMATLRLSACGLSWAASWLGSSRRCRWNQDACAPAVQGCIRVHQPGSNAHVQGNSLQRMLHKAGTNHSR